MFLFFKYKLKNKKNLIQASLLDSEGLGRTCKSVLIRTLGSFRIHSLGNTDLVKSLTGSESSSYCLLNCFRIVVQILDIFTFVVLGSKDVIPRSINNTHLSKGKIQYKENYRNAMGKLSLSFRFISILLGALVKSQLQQNWSRCRLLLTIRYSMSLLIYFT